MPTKNYDIGITETAKFGASEPLSTNIISNKTGKVLGKLNSLDDALGITQKTANGASSGLDWFGNNGIIGSVGAGLNGIASVWGAYNAFTQGNKQLKEMRRQNDLLEKQYNTEMERYNKREAERDASNSYFSNMANNMYQKYYANYANSGANADNSQTNGTNSGANTPNLNNTAQNEPNLTQNEQEKNLLPTERE